jgi:hypothetical protein
MKSVIPLICDLDNTLIDGDILMFMIKKALKNNPYCIFFITYLFFINKSSLKDYLLNQTNTKIDNFKINEEIMSLILKKRNNQDILIYSGSPDKLVASLKKKYSFIIYAEGSKNGFNNVGMNKLKNILTKYDEFEFDYVGDSYKDVFIWHKSRRAYVYGSYVLFLFLKLILGKRTSIVFIRRNVY